MSTLCSFSIANGWGLRCPSYSSATPSSTRRRSGGGSTAASPYRHTPSAMAPEAFDDIVDFMLAREVGSICLGYPSYRNELLPSWVAPIPFLRHPLNRLRTFSRDRYGAFHATVASRVDRGGV